VSEFGGASNAVAVPPEPIVYGPPDLGF